MNENGSSTGKNPIPKFSIVAPFLNEEKSLEFFCEELQDRIRLCGEEVEVIFVDDGSTDNSVKTIRKFHWEKARIIQLNRNMGHQIALSYGIHEASGEFIGMLDTDGQHPQEILFEMFSIAKKNRIHIVQGVRSNRKSDSFFKSSTASMYYFFISKITGIKVIPNAADFRVITADCATRLKTLKDMTPLRVSIPSLELATYIQYFDVQARKEGTSKYSFSKMFNLALLSAVKFSMRPLQFIFTLGIMTAILSTFLILLTFASFLSGHTVPGWSSIVTIITFFGGLQLISFGTMAYYLVDHLKVSNSNRGSFRMIEISDEVNDY